MCFFAFVGSQAREADWMSCGLHESDLGVYIPHEFLILHLHIVVDLEMHMDVFLSFSLDHPGEEMLERFDIFAMHTYQECTIWGLDSDIDIIS